MQVACRLGGAALGRGFPLVAVGRRLCSCYVHECFGIFLHRWASCGHFVRAGSGGGGADCGWNDAGGDDFAGLAAGSGWGFAWRCGCAGPCRGACQWACQWALWDNAAGIAAGLWVAAAVGAAGGGGVCLAVARCAGRGGDGGAVAGVAAGKAGVTAVVPDARHRT